jgi:hypothetical protein
MEGFLMETVIDPVSTGLASALDHPPQAMPRQRGETTQSLAAPVQPVNAPIAQLVGTNNVSTNTPAGSAAAIASAKPREVFIHGVTSKGRTFRPSDWAERLAGAMSSFRPGGGKGGPGAHIGYSPYCVPTSFGDVKCVIVNEALRKIEPMAWDFVMNFAKDNDLQVLEGCLLPDPPRK